jgi:hypothetical protein
MVSKDWIHEFGAGFTSGLATAFVCAPCDVVRTRLQVQDMAAADVHYDSLKGTVQKILSEEGLYGLYRGFTATAVGIPACW